jgi:hypothetical protein
MSCTSRIAHRITSHGIASLTEITAAHLAQEHKSLSQSSERVAVAVRCARRYLSLYLSSTRQKPGYISFASIRRLFFRIVCVVFSYYKIFFRIVCPIILCSLLLP